jgi:GGDEF domain-containing protein
LIENRGSLLVLAALIPATLLASLVSLIAPPFVAIVLAAVMAAAISVWAVALAAKGAGERPRSAHLISSLLERQVQHGKRLSIVDPQTTLLMRWYFDLRVSEEMTRCHRYGSKMTLLSVRRAEGQPAEGDASELDYVQVFARGLRNLDFATRLSSGRYCVCMPHTDGAGAEAAALRLIGESGETSVLIGIAEYDGSQRDVSAFIEQAFAVTSAHRQAAPGPWAADDITVAPAAPATLPANLFERVRAEESGHVELAPDQTRRDVRTKLRRAARKAGVALQLEDSQNGIYFQRLPANGPDAGEHVA